MADLTCPSCKAPVPVGAKYCLSCGAKLDVQAAPGGARCVTHPEIAAQQTCSRCGNFACAECLIQRPSGAVVCTSCAAREPVELLPWDRRQELGVFKAYWKTCWLLIQYPNKTLSAAPQEGSFGGSVLFALVSSYCALLTTMLVYAVVMTSLMGPLMDAAAHAGGQAHKAADQPPTWIFTLVFLAYGLIGPVFMVGGMILISLVDHLALKLVGGANATWSVTFRAHALSTGPYIIGLIPLCGLQVAPIWALVLRVFAYRGLHRTTTGKAAFGALAPSISLGLCCVGGYAVMLMTIFERIARK
jgi:hypothetical protein